MTEKQQKAKVRLKKQEQEQEKKEEEKRERDPCRAHIHALKKWSSVAIDLIIIARMPRFFFRRIFVGLASKCII